MKTAEAKILPASSHQGGKRQPFFGHQQEAVVRSIASETAPFFSKPVSVQAKLTVGQPNDKYEQEADAVADKVVQKLSEPETVQAKQISPSIPSIQAKCAECEKEDKLQKKEEELGKDEHKENGVKSAAIPNPPDPPVDNKEKDKKGIHLKPIGVTVSNVKAIQPKPIFESDAENPVQKKCDQCEKEEKLQKKESGQSDTASLPNIESRLDASKGSGTSLPDATRRSMESSMGADFSNVKVHTDSGAVQMSKDLNAQAFTHGSDIYFNSGKYDPSSKSGQHLLAHELTHTVQQGAAIYRKLIQRNGTSTPGTGTPLKGPPYVLKGNKLDQSVNPRILNIAKISLPDFKKRNEPKFKLPLQTLQPRPEGTKQVVNWNAAVKSSVNAKVAALLENQSATSDGIYFLKSKSSAFRIFGTLKQIQEESYIPKWNRFGEGNLHQVDHIVEMQLGGEDQVDNYELTDDRANTNSGNSIKLERERKVGQALKAFNEAGVPNLPTVKEASNEYIVSFFKIENWNLPYDGNGRVFWTKVEIDRGKHLEQLRLMTPKEIAESQGTTEELAIYVNENSGRPLKIPMPFGSPINNWLPGLDLVSLTHTPSAADNKTFGSIGIQLRQDFSDKLKSGQTFTISFNKTRGLLNTGYLTFTKDQQGLSGQLRFIGLSPIYIEQFMLDDKKGIVINGKIKTDIPIFKGAEIDLSVEGRNFMLSKRFSLGEIKDFPSPFKVTDLSLIAFASTTRGLGVEGNLDYEIARVGKGRLVGIGSTGEGFGIKGDFDFDPDLFKSKISVSYINNAFSFDGSATLEKGKLKGVDKLNVDLSYKQGVLKGDGHATLSIPGVKEVIINVTNNPGGGFTLEGEIEFGNIKKLKSTEAKVKVIISKTADGWETGIVGNLKPNIDVAGLQIKEVNISYIKGVFDVSAKAHFGKGKINGDITAGVTNSIITPEGKKGEGIGKELNFYADGVLRMLIIKGVEVELKVRIKSDGDVIIGGKLDLKEDKFIINPREADSKSDPKLNIWDFKKSIPVASCGVASLVLGLKAGIGLFYNFEGLKVDRGTNVQMDEVSLNDLEKASFKSDITVSTGIKAGVDAYIGASAGLQVLIAGVKGEGTINLRLTAIEATAKANVKADFSVNEGLQFKEANFEFDVASKIAIEVVLGISVYLDLLFTELTLWSHDWKPDSLKGERAFHWFDGVIKVPLKFGENNSLTMDNITDALKAGIEPKAKDQAMYEKGANKGVNEEGPTQEEKNEESKQNIKRQIKQAYRGTHSNAVFTFDQTLDPVYFEQRDIAWFTIDNLENLDPKIKDLLKEEIRRYEFEEYEAFGVYLEKETYFNENIKYQLIDEFLMHRPTLGSTEKANLRSLVVNIKPKQSGSKKKPGIKKGPGKPPVQKKPIFENNFEEPIQKKENNEVQSDSCEALNDKLDKAGQNGSPLLPDTSKKMNEAFGKDFSAVRIHDDNKAAQMSNELNAQAFTHGNDIYFNQGKYNPETKEGKHLLAHELTHTIQQGSSNQIQRTPGDKHDLTSTSLGGDPILESTFDNETVVGKFSHSNGEHVKRIQQALISLGIELPKFGADEKFGTETENGVKEFQQKAGMSPKEWDGIVGRKTIGLLDRSLRNGAISTDTDKAEDDLKVDNPKKEADDEACKGKSTEKPCPDPNKIVNTAADEAIKLIDKVLDEQLPPVKNKKADYPEIFTRIFRNGDSRDIGFKVDEVRKNYEEIKKFLGRIKKEKDLVRCATECDGGCRSGSPAYHSAPGGKHIITFCPDFEKDDKRILIVLHECHHASIPGSSDKAYADTRLFEKLDHNKALLNAASFHVYAAWVEKPGSESIGPDVKDTNLIADKAQKDKTDLALAFMEQWFRLVTFDISETIQGAQEAKDKGHYTKKNPRVFMELVFSKWFGMNRPPLAPTELDIKKLKAIENRTVKMEKTFSSPFVIIETPNQSFWTNGPGNDMALNQNVLSRDVQHLVIALLQELVHATPNISAESEPLYVGTINDMRNLRELDP